MNEEIEHKKLLAAYEALQAENLTLKDELEALRRQRKSHPSEVHDC